MLQLQHFLNVLCYTSLMLSARALLAVNSHHQAEYSVSILVDGDLILWVKTDFISIRHGRVQSINKHIEIRLLMEAYGITSIRA